MPELKMKYFVLNPNKKDWHGTSSRKAIMAYAGSIRYTEPDFATELEMWVRNIERELGLKV